MIKHLLTIIYLFFTTMGITLMKQGGNSISINLKDNFSMKIGYITILGFLCYIISFLIWQRLLVKFDLSYIVPITAGITQILVLIIGKLVFKEDITFLSLFGVMIVIIGISLIVLGKK